MGEFRCTEQPYLMLKRLDVCKTIIKVYYVGMGLAVSGFHKNVGYKHFY